MRRGEVWWADLGPFRPREQTGRRPVVIWQSNALTSILQSVLVIPLTTNLDRANLAGTAAVHASPKDGLPEDSIALAFQMRAVPKTALDSRARVLTETELAELSWPPTRLSDGSNTRPISETRNVIGLQRCRQASAASPGLGGFQLQHTRGPAPAFPRCRDSSLGIH